MNMEQEFAQADQDLQQMIHESLDKCFQAGAPAEELKFLAWQTGCSDWTPTVIRRH